MQDDATALAEAIAGRHLKAVEAMQASLVAAEASAALGAVAYVDAEYGMRRAAAIDTLLSRGSTAAMDFAGVPALAKDLGGPFAGFPVTAGSTMLKRRGGSEDSDLAARFNAAGLCVFGLTTSPEFGLSLSSEPRIGPICRNPLDPTRTAGGSSGGSAGAVAAGIVAIAHATDAGGSIRVPSACCGLVGLKPSRGAIPGGPGFGNHLGGLASELAVCRSVRDAKTVFHALSGTARGPFPPFTPLSPKTGSLRIGILTDTGSRYPTASDRLSVIEEAGRTLEAKGHRLIAIPFSAVEQPAEASRKAFVDIVCANLADTVAKLNLDPSRAEEMTQAVIDRGLSMSAVDLWRSLSAMVIVSRDLWRLFDGIDCLLCPILSCAPLPIGAFPTDHRDTDVHFERMAAFSPLAALANASGCPAVTLPFGSDEDGLPLPVQIIAPMGEDLLLLELAAALERVGRFQQRFAVAGFGPS